MVGPTLSERIQGAASSRILREFVTNSALFPIFDAIRAITTEGLTTYLLEPPHYLILASAAVQAWFLGRRLEYPWWQRALGNLIAPALYSAFDLLLEGPADFFGQYYHWVFWAYALGMAGLYAVEDLLSSGRQSVTILQNLWRVMLFPTLYVLSELSGELAGPLTWASFQSYWQSSSGHAFILMAALLFGLLLGLNESRVDRYTAYLREAARRLKQFSEWSLDLDLVEQSMDNLAALRQRRVERTVLFMDIRGFTQWSEDKDPEIVVGMLNQFYELAENILTAGGGRKPHFIADEVMTWFEDPQQAVQTGHTLRAEVNRLLADYHLACGLGLHIGEVVEGLMGSSDTRSYNIIGDVVNTASRLESNTSPGEMVISEELALRLGLIEQSGPPRLIEAKGKQQPLKAYSL